MSDNIRELDQVQAELDILHERSQTNKANISSHEAVCEVRHKIIMENMNSISKELRVVAGLVTLFSVLYKMLPK